jgi:hypothetical protein
VPCAADARGRFQREVNRDLTSKGDLRGTGLRPPSAVRKLISLDAEG